VLYFIEGVRGKPISPENEGIITLIGFGFVMVFMVLVTWNDIQRFFFYGESLSKKVCKEIKNSCF
ncbi:hypothetical protein ACPTI2_13860, partial [Enterococcus faecalis]